MNHWLLETLGDKRVDALQEAARAQVYTALVGQPSEIDYDLIERVAQALETAVVDLLLTSSDDEEQLAVRRKCAADAYRLYCVLPKREDPLVEAELSLRWSALAVLGDLGSAAARQLRERPWPNLDLEAENWRTRTLSTIIDIWLRLIRKRGWEDRDLVLDRIKKLRDAQESFEASYLTSTESAAKAAALELMSLYHLAKAAEILGLYITDGKVDGSFQINNLLEMQFDRALAACDYGVSFQLEPLTRLLAATARQLADNSIWTVTRAVNSRVTKFVNTLVSRGRGEKALFDVLPPQRRALAERGLLGSSRRAVVVSLPTSSGKTLIAQFRILQALNQFDEDCGWVAYLAPTRTLVRQITRQLRRDFEPFGVVVEQVSAALDVDNIESALLSEQDKTRAFRVLVTTPEKLDLMLRQGWEAKTGRPLTLVVVDEAHNIQEGARGLKLELLLSTINVECQRAQFLLLTPFIDNAREVARWLGDANSDDISLSLDWQPNDRVIGVVHPVKGEQKGRGYDYKLNMETVHTTRATLAIDEMITFDSDPNSNKTFSKISNQSDVAAATAKELVKRGPVIVMHSRPDFVWSLAEKLKSDARHLPPPSEKVKLAQEFLALEMGDNFPLIGLLENKVGVHHSGLSDDTRALMEWLFECGELNFLAATTTIAQGVNFPVSGVVMASHQYPYAVDMPPADFWNIAGRAGRVDQGTLGVIALAADSSAKLDELKTFINKQTGALNSALIRLVIDTGDKIDDLGLIVYQRPEWSAFVQYLVHTYQQMGRPPLFSDQIEQILRGTFGFSKLRTLNEVAANRLLRSIRSYTEYMEEPNQPLKLVDSTGFSLQSIKTAMNAAGQEGLGRSSWNASTLFDAGNDNLKKMMGVLLKVPELRNNLNAVIGGEAPDGNKLSLIIKDWVAGRSVPDIAREHFSKEGRGETETLTECGRNLFGKLTQTAAWGLGALLSIIAREAKTSLWFCAKAERGWSFAKVHRIEAESKPPFYQGTPSTPLKVLRCERKRKRLCRVFDEARGFVQARVLFPVMSFSGVFLGRDVVCSFQREPLTIHSTSPVADPKAHLRASGQGLCPRHGVPDFRVASLAASRVIPLRGSPFCCGGLCALSDRCRGRMERPPKTERNSIMSIIGTFTKQNDGFQGNIETLTIKAKANFVSVEKSGDKAPDFRLYAGKAEIGAAWSSKSKEGKAYISVKLDDPSFAAPILCRLVESDKGHNLVWTRQ